MRDIVFGQAKGLAAQWRQEAAQRRGRTKVDPAADALDSCAAELDATLAAIERDTKPLTVAQYAKQVGAYPGSVRKWIVRGQLTAEKNAAGDWLIPRGARREIGAAKRAPLKRAS